MNSLEHGDELRKVVKGAGITFIGRIVGSGLQFLYHIVIARFLGAELLGLYLLGLTVTNITSVLARFGLDRGILRFVPVYLGEGDIPRVKGTLLYSFNMAMMMSIIMGGLLFISSGMIAERVFQKPDLADILRILSISLPFYVLFTLALSGMQAFHAMKFNVYVQNLFLPISTLGLTVILFFFGFRMFGVIIAYMISLICAVIVAFYLLLRVFPAMKEAIKPAFDGRKLLTYSSPLLLVAFLNFSLLWTDVLMLGYFRTSAEVGIYSVAVKTALLNILVLVALNSIFTPMMSDLFNRREMTKVEGLFKALTRWTFLVSFAFFLITVLISKEIMGLFGPEFIVGWGCLIILVFSQLINSATGSVGEMLTMSGKQTITLYNGVFAVILNVLLNAILIPSYGMIGGAVATGVALAALNLISLIEVQYFYKIHPYSREFLKPLMIGMLAFMILFLLKDWFSFSYGPATIVSVFAAFVAIYLSGLAIVGLSRDDHFVLELFKRKFFSKALEPFPHQ